MVERLTAALKAKRLRRGGLAAASLDRSSSSSTEQTSAQLRERGSASAPLLHHHDVLVPCHLGSVPEGCDSHAHDPTRATWGLPPPSGKPYRAGVGPPLTLRPGSGSEVKGRSAATSERQRATLDGAERPTLEPDPRQGVLRDAVAVGERSEP